MRVAGTRTMPSARARSPAWAGGGLPGPGARTGEPGGSGSRSPGPAWPAPEPPARSQARELGRGGAAAAPPPGAGGPERCPRVLQPRWGSWPRPASSPCRPPSSWGGSSTSSTQTPRRISAVTWPASASHSAASSCAGPLPMPSASTSCKPQVRASRGPAVGAPGPHGHPGPPPPGTTPMRTGSRGQVSPYRWPWVKLPPPAPPSHGRGECEDRARVSGDFGAWPPVSCRPSEPLWACWPAIRPHPSLP